MVTDMGWGPGNGPDAGDTLTGRAPSWLCAFDPPWPFGSAGQMKADLLYHGSGLAANVNEILCHSSMLGWY